MAVLSSGHAFVILEGDGTDTYSFSFPYLDESHIVVEVDGVSEAFTFPTASSVQITSGAVSAPSRVEIRRETSRSARLVDFQDGASLTEADLDLDSDQVFYISQEAIDEVSKSLRIDTATNTVDFQNARGTNLDDPTAATDVMNNQSMSTSLTAAQAAQAAAEAAQTAAETAETNAAASEAATAADAVSTAADAAATAADAIATAADRVQTGLDAAATAADVVSTNADAASTAADVVSTNADAASTAADVVSTNADAAATAADAVSTAADASTCTTKASEAAASAAAALASENAAAASAANSLGNDIEYKTASYSVVDADNGEVHRIDCTSGAVTVTLPIIASGVTLNVNGAGWKIRIKKTDSSTNAVTINRSSTDTLEGATSISLSDQHDWVDLFPDTSQSPDQWTYVTGNSGGGVTATGWTSYTPTLSSGFGTVTQTEFFYRKIDSTLYVRGYFRCGTVAAAAGSITLPSGETLDNTYLVTGDFRDKVGIFTYLNTSTPFFPTSGAAGVLFPDGTATDKLFFGYLAASTTQIEKTNVSSYIGTNFGVNVEFTVPVT